MSSGTSYESYTPFQNSRGVIDIYSEYVPDEVIATVQNVYHEHGWPNLGQYRKEDCLKAIEAIMADRFPRHINVASTSGA
jgi:hypothetical protein